MITLTALKNAITDIMNSSTEKEARKAFLNGVGELAGCSGAICVILEKNSGTYTFRNEMSLSLSQKFVTDYGRFCDENPFLHFISSKRSYFVCHDSEFFSKEMRSAFSVFSFIKNNGFSDCISYSTDFYRNICVQGIILRSDPDAPFTEDDTELVRILVFHLSRKLDSLGFTSSIDINTLLTPKEKAVFLLLVEGKSTKEIASALGITERTVKFHAGHIYTKCNTDSKAKLIARYGASFVK